MELEIILLSFDVIWHQMVPNEVKWYHFDHCKMTSFGTIWCQMLSNDNTIISSSTAITDLKAKFFWIFFFCTIKFLAGHFSFLIFLDNVFFSGHFIFYLDNKFFSVQKVKCPWTLSSCVTRPDFFYDALFDINPM